MFRYLLAAIGLILSLPLLVLLVLALPITSSGLGYVLGYLLVVIGLILAPRVHKYYVVIAIGIVTILIVASVRISSIQTGTPKVLAFPRGDPTYWFNNLIDEQDALIFGETVFHFIGGDSDREHENLTSSFMNVYSQMREDGSFSSPVFSTYLNLQRPEHFDAVIIEPETEPQFGVIFLHGYMGNVSAQCWVIAQAVKEMGGVTVCPSTVWTGAWWEPRGQQILQHTFEYVREQGIERIYLGGFSNGGFSIGRLAPQLADEEGLSGLIFIDGFMNGTQVKELGLPTLIIEGTEDERVPVEAALQFVNDVGDLGTHVEINSDHFLIIKEPAMAQRAIATWLKNQMNP
jgi:pimeloyl-ACP methyl ester carboxylesterase